MYVNSHVDEITQKRSCLNRLNYDQQSVEKKIQMLFLKVVFVCSENYVSLGWKPTKC